MLVPAACSSRRLPHSDYPDADDVEDVNNMKISTALLFARLMSEAYALPVESAMALITRRQFVQQAAFSAAFLSGFPDPGVYGRISLNQLQKSASIDTAAIRKLASKITAV